MTFVQTRKHLTSRVHAHGPTHPHASNCPQCLPHLNPCSVLSQTRPPTRAASPHLVPVPAHHATLIRPSSSQHSSANTHQCTMHLVDVQASFAIRDRASIFQLATTTPSCRGGVLNKGRRPRQLRAAHMWRYMVVKGI
jgi:hypothetical protein